jgi:hypothetical protein
LPPGAHRALKQAESHVALPRPEVLNRGEKSGKVPNSTFERFSARRRLARWRAASPPFVEPR